MPNINRLNAMKKKLLKTFFIITLVFLDFVAFAQNDGPGMNNAANTLEADDAPDTPVSGKLMYLGIAGIAFAYYVYKQKRILKVQN